MIKTIDHTRDVFLKDKRIKKKITETRVYNDDSYSETGRAEMFDYIKQKNKEGITCFMITNTHTPNYGPKQIDIFGSSGLSIKETYKAVNPNDEPCEFIISLISKEYDEVTYFRNDHQGKKIRYYTTKSNPKDF